jgi:hypothetical protein
VDQTTWRPVYTKDASKALTPDDISNIFFHAEEHYSLLQILPHGGRVYDAYGVNLCLTNCMTRDTDLDNLRQLILFPNGRIAYDWDKPGSVIL